MTRRNCRRRVYAVDVYYGRQTQVLFSRQPARTDNRRRVWEPGTASLGRLCRVIGRLT